MSITPDKMASTYLKIKAKREALKRAFDAEDKEYKEQQEMIRSALLKTCKSMNVSSLKTDAGTIIRTVKQKYWTSDWESMYEFVMKHGVPELLTRSLNQSNLKEFLENNPELFPQGLNIDAEEAISVRKPAKKTQ